MTTPNPERLTAFRAGIQAFLDKRLQSKLEKLKPDDPDYDQDCAALKSSFRRDVWLEDAAHRARQIQVATHTLKAIHGDARGTNLYCKPSSLNPLNVVGSHLLGENFVADVVGNAAALDVYKFLKVEADGQTLLQALLEQDAAAIAALHPDSVQAQTWAKAFAGLAQATGKTASHTLGKQVYWLTGDDASDDAHFVLLAPLFPTSLMHKLHVQLQADLYGEAAKAARDAKKAEKPHEHGYAVYPQLAVRKLGGTKPQNISQMNSERGGVNYLLASLPPVWDSQRTPPYGVDHIFPAFGKTKPVREILARFQGFLKNNPPKNLATRTRVKGYLEDLLDELSQYTSLLREELPAHWSADPRCILDKNEQCWLDPHRQEIDEVFQKDWHFMDWPLAVAMNFSIWLNNAMQKLGFGDAESREWQKSYLLNGTWVQELYEWRLEFDSPQYQSVKMQALAGYKAAQQAEKDALERDMENDDE